VFDSSRRRLLAVAAASVITGAWRTDRAAANPGRDKAAHNCSNTARWQGLSLHAPGEIQLPGVCGAEAKDLLSAVENEIRRLESLFSLREPGSAIARLNAAGFLRNPPPDFLRLLSQVDWMHTVSGGLFDPTIQPLWALYAQTKGVPEAAELAATRALLGWSSVQVSAHEVKLKTAGAALSLNGIAQGYITDRIADFLIAEDIQNALIKLGELRLLGHGNDGLPWRIGLADSEGSEPDTYLRLSDKAVATSAVYGTTFDGSVSHILNPLTGGPASPRWRRVTAVHNSAAACDAISTAAVLMDEQAIEQLPARLDGLVIHAMTEGGDIKSFPPAFGAELELNRTT
jgi:thiamine biosynthesis lipoprotein